MSKRRPRGKKTPQADKSTGAGSDSGKPKGRAGSATEKSAAKHVPSPAAIRETIESIVVAFVLAFLFRTFEAEAFVIPTGSMAPTLMGRHKDLECPICGYPYQASASDEVDPNTNADKGPGAQIVACTCPMCRYPLDLRSAVAAELGDELTEEIERILTEELDLAPEVAAELAGKIKRKPASEIEDQLARELNLPYRRGADVAEKLAKEIERIVASELPKTYPSFKGDRILVGKFCYEFGEPRRWDVAVFKYPGGAQTNFIKRLVGLPGETIRIYHGDIFVKPDGGHFAIARKERPEKLLAMLQPVYDNDYVVPAIMDLDWVRWARWRPWPATGSGADGAWKTSKDYRSFRTDGPKAGETWIRYEHRVPAGWEKREEGKWVPVGDGRPQLISDFAAYNTSRAAKDQYPDFDSAGLHWVGDLAVRCTLEVLQTPSESSQAVLELVEGGWRMQCRIDVATGKATLAIEHPDASRHTARTIEGKPYGPTAQTAVRGPGKYEVIFSNCDDQLRLWVCGRAVQFDTTTCYEPLHNLRPVDDPSFASDFSPVGIGARGAALRASHLKILRDIYYIAEKNSRPGNNNALTDFQQVPAPRGILSDPDLWDAFDDMQMVPFALKEDQFLALGDNSPKSKDGRLWGGEGFEYYVKRELLIGKALYIYWPHSWNKLPNTDVPFPLFPNVARMRFVR